MKIDSQQAKWLVLCPVGIGLNILLLSLIQSAPVFVQGWTFLASFFVTMPLMGAKFFQTLFHIWLDNKRYDLPKSHFEDVIAEALVDEAVTVELTHSEDLSCWACKRFSMGDEYEYVCHHGQNRMAYSKGRHLGFNVVGVKSLGDITHILTNTMRDAIIKENKLNQQRREAIDSIKLKMIGGKSDNSI